jgi:hypothetical protein
MALCNASRTLHYVDTGITLAHGIAEFMPDKFLRMHHGFLFRNKSRINELREIPCFPIKHVLRHLEVKDIDVWVLDTEGAELSVLQGFDFSAVNVKVVIMECDGHDHLQDQRKMQYLQEHGYSCGVVSHPTCLCRHQDFLPSVGPAAVGRGMEAKAQAQFRKAGFGGGIVAGAGRKQRMKGTAAGAASAEAAGLGSAGVLIGAVGSNGGSIGVNSDKAPLPASAEAALVMAKRNKMKAIKKKNKILVKNAMAVGDTGRVQDTA